MLDLRVLRNLWTDAGAREVFAQLVTQCVRHTYGYACSVRPHPGDEGIDTLVGEFEAGALKIWQAKYFCEGLGDPQKKQIRDSWKTCHSSDYFHQVKLWTLCLPDALSVDELKWWQSWKKKQSNEHNCQMELWSKDDFIGFRSNETLRPIFDQATSKTSDSQTHTAVLASMGAGQPQIQKLPDSTRFKHAIFVKKLEAAGVKEHRSARTAFYNFELFRTAVAEGGNAKEVSELESLEERVLDIWETEFNRHAPDSLGRPLLNAVNARIEQEAATLLSTTLQAGLIHKKGAVHYWADLCEAGWTADHRAVGEEDE